MKRSATEKSYYVRKKRHSRKRHDIKRYFWVLLVVLPVAAYLYSRFVGSPIQAAPKLATNTPAPVKSADPLPKAEPGDVLGIVSIQHFTAAQALALAKENFGAQTLPVTVGVTKVTFRYRSQLPTGQLITEYARAYLPDAQNNLPIFAFAPGTTGIGDECAASLENVKVANWGNYDSDMTMYASQGYAAVTTDYEGMLDPTRIHHYMVGELEGRAVLDSVRALERLPQTAGRLNTDKTFVAGYSQGGHAAYWADKIDAAYSPDVKLAGVIGFGPVMSVSETLDDVTHGANINWFGPYLLYSYADYYKTTYPIYQILSPTDASTLNTAVPAHCIDTDLPYWGIRPAAVYTPQFIQAMSTNQVGTMVPQFQKEMDENAVGADPSSTPKLINSGALDNVVLPAQQRAEAVILCQSSVGAVKLDIYPNTTHYTTMLNSLHDTLSWMDTIVHGGQVPSTCPGAGTT